MQSDKSTTLEQTSQFLKIAIEETGRQPCLFGNPISAAVAASPAGGLPLFYEYARKVAGILEDEPGGWLPGIQMEADPESLIGARLVCQKELTGVARYPVIALFYESLTAALRMSSTPDRLELADLTSTLQSEVLHELSINRWPDVHPAAAEEKANPR